MADVSVAEHTYDPGKHVKCFDFDETPYADCPRDQSTNRVVMPQEDACPNHGAVWPDALWITLFGTFGYRRFDSLYWEEVSN